MAQTIKDPRVFYLYDRSEDKSSLIGKKEDLLNFLRKTIIAGDNHCRNCFGYGCFYPVYDKMWKERIPFTAKEAIRNDLRHEIYKEFDFTGSDTNRFSYTKLERRFIKDEDGEVKAITFYATYEDVYLRRYVVYDNEKRIIDIRNYEDDVILVYKGDTFYRKRESRLNGCKHGEVVQTYWFKDSSLNYRFRCDPVPCRGHSTYHCSYAGHRAMNIKQAELIRPRTRIESCELWDGVPRHTDRSWKTSHKCRHQWEKHMERRSKSNNVYVSKGLSSIYEETLDDVLSSIYDEMLSDEEAA